MNDPLQGGRCSINHSRSGTPPNLQSIIHRSERLQDPTMLSRFSIRTKLTAVIAFLLVAMAAWACSQSGR
jgi:hypothetical protein